jgi:hypothetical protein
MVMPDIFVTSWPIANTGLQQQQAWAGHQGKTLNFDPPLLLLVSDQGS